MKRLGGIYYRLPRIGKFPSTIYSIAYYMELIGLNQVVDCMPIKMILKQPLTGYDGAFRDQLRQGFSSFFVQWHVYKLLVIRQSLPHMQRYVNYVIYQTLKLRQ